MYQFTRKILFLCGPEWVHYFSMNCLQFLFRIPFVKKFITNQFSVSGNRLERKCFGLTFKNPVGLGAGFDKNAKYLNELEALGFGFIEIGTVTPLAQTGNDKPRLFRLSEDKALINRMGFNNDGVEIIAGRLKKWKRTTDGRQQAKDNRRQTIENQRPMVNGQSSTEEPENLKSHSPFIIDHSRLIIGGNIGKNKTTLNEDAWKDYEICFKALYPYVDYFVVNVSSPNTPGLRELQGKESLRKILTNLQELNSSMVSGQSLIDKKQLAIKEPESLDPVPPFIIDHSPSKPILLKIAPDLTQGQIDDVIDLALEIELDGLVATNTTISRGQLKTENSKLQTIGAGGLSGAPLKKRSTETVKYICKKTDGRIPVIASGGIFTAADATEKIVSGASLVQIWTGFIYEGPGIVKKICGGL